MNRLRMPSRYRMPLKKRLAKSPVNPVVVFVMLEAKLRNPTMTPARGNPKLSKDLSRMMPLSQKSRTNRKTRIVVNSANVVVVIAGGGAGIIANAR